MRSNDISHYAGLCYHQKTQNQIIHLKSKLHHQQGKTKKGRASTKKKSRNMYQQL